MNNFFKRETINLIEVLKGFFLIFSNLLSGIEPSPLSILIIIKSIFIERMRKL